ncbi:hypothetical protein RDI58_014876 [Solanum bulbocastanum]|uniref:Uncharacterized protein n=1 Tax=Solanum bulbocastanum TaxID=147425 RepID=A0AAN8TM80_SOLBU
MVEVVYRSFQWIGNGKISRKALVAWDKVCQPGSIGGMNVINLQLWNNVAILKHLWAISMKKDTLLIRWIHYNYVKNLNVVEMNTPKNVTTLHKHVYGV